MVASAQSAPHTYVLDICGRQSQVQYCFCALAANLCVCMCCFWFMCVSCLPGKRQWHR
jgi:hypothetical protein